MTTSPDSRVEWFFVPDSVLDRLDTGAAKLAFQKSNPFNDPEAHNCKLSFLPDDKYATWIEARRKSTVALPLPRSEEASTLRHQLSKVVGPEIGKKPDLMWPIVVRSSNPFHNGADFHFKLPSSANPNEFFAELRAAGLLQGKFCVSHKKETDEWWYRYLFYPGEKQSKVQGKGKGKRQSEGQWNPLRRGDHVQRAFKNYSRDFKERVGGGFGVLPEQDTRGGKS